MGTNVAVGILRPPHVFFYEVDVKKGNFRYNRWMLERYAKWFFKSYSIYRTKHGYHLISYPFKRKLWRVFVKAFPSDFTKKLRPRWNKRNPQVLRISEKWDLKTGRITSPAPKFICGNLKLNNLVNGIQKYKVLYYAK